MKIGFYISISIMVVSLLALWYYNYSTYRQPIWFWGFFPSVIAWGSISICLIWGGAYYLLSRDIWALVLLGGFVGGFLIFFASQKYIQMKEGNIITQQHEQWEKIVQNTRYDSYQHGLSFSYITPDEHLGKISVREESDRVLLWSEKGDFIGGIQIFEKSPENTLMQALEIRYEKEVNSGCRFTQELLPGDAELSKRYPSWAHIHAVTGEQCTPLFFSGAFTRKSLETRGYSVFIESEDRDRYIFIFSDSDRGLFAWIPTAMEQYPPFWFETITFMK